MSLMRLLVAGRSLNTVKNQPSPYKMKQANLLPKFASKKATEGTAEENKAILKGVVGSFGTYTVNEAEKTVVTTVEGGVFPNLVGVAQQRKIVTLNATELKYVNPATSTGTVAEAVWKRAK